MHKMDYHYKYLKYKTKYFKLVAERNASIHRKKNQLGGTNQNETESDPPFDNSHTSITEANNHFAIDFFENFDGASNIFSPISIIYVLSLIHLAAIGRTDTQLTNLLGHKFSVDDLHGVKKLFDSDSIKMMTEAIINKKYQINPEYIDMIRPLAKIIYTDFSNGDLIVSKVNKYIEQNTNGMIKNVISPGSIKENDTVIIINTIYFKSYWLNKFDPKLTTKMRFHRTREDVVDMMHQKNSFNYYENSSVQLIEMPYVGGNFMMGIVLPKKYLEEENLSYSINNVPIISEPQLTEMINNLGFTDVDLYIPKFTQRKKIEIVPILKKMGITNLFDKSNAELDLISPDAFVSDIIHEAVVIVDEEGTEASAATAMIMEKSAYIEQKPKLFKADHAFIYYIRDAVSGIILFLGDYQGN